MSDNAPTHTAIVVRETFEVMILPPHSPDLNAIENVWPLLQAGFYDLRLI